MYVLYLNPVNGRFEDRHAVARATSPEALVAFLEREAAEPYRDGGWLKRYRGGGPLEWYNPPDGSPYDAIVDAEATLAVYLAARREWLGGLRCVDAEASS